MHARVPAGFERFEPGACTIELQVVGVRCQRVIFVFVARATLRCVSLFATRTIMQAMSPHSLLRQRHEALIAERDALAAALRQSEDTVAKLRALLPHRRDDERAIGVQRAEHLIEP